MDLSTKNQAVIRGLMIGALVLAGASACSRSDRTESGSNTGAMTADTMSAEPQTSAATPSQFDTAGVAGSDTASATAASPTPAPRAETGSVQDTSTAGYRGMERDTSSEAVPTPTDTARATTDSAIAPGEQSSAEDRLPTQADSAPMEVATSAVADTSVNDSEVALADTTAGDAEMARDTSTGPEQADTAMAAGEADVAIQADVDTAGNVDAAAAQSDTAVQVGDSAHVARTGERLDPVVASAETNDTLVQPEGTPVRPPEDSTEVYGNVNSDDAVDEQEMKQEDRETVAAAETQTDNAPTEAVGAAAIGGTVSGADAVALMTRQGVQCIVVDPESAQGVALDMSETPATLNPCGLGSMVPTRIWTRR